MDTLNVGITGMGGFIGAHLRDRLQRQDDIAIVPFEKSYFNNPDDLKDFLENCNIIVHLAAMNRGEPEEIFRTNVDLVRQLVDTMEQLSVTPHVIFASSTQCREDNLYGRSKKEGARILGEWAGRTSAALSVLIIPNVFGDQGRPFYNSVIATFCHQITHNEMPQIHVDSHMSLIYVNELIEIMFDRIDNPPDGVETVEIKPTTKAKVTEVLGLLEKFRDFYYNNKIVPEVSNNFERNLYNTFITYMDNSDYEQKPALHSDDRGMLFEIVKQTRGGQVFFSATKPGITRGNHYHTRKMEKFCVVRGEAIIRLRRIGTDDIIQYRVSDDSPSSIEIPIFYTHSIENVGETELLTLFWTNELFEPNDPDTFYECVIPEKK